MQNTAIPQQVELPEKNVELRIIRPVTLTGRRTDEIRALEEVGQAFEIPENKRSSYLQLAMGVGYHTGAKFTTRKQPDGKVLLIRTA